MYIDKGASNNEGLEKKQAQIFPYNFTERHESLRTLTVRDKEERAFGKTLPLRIPKI